MRCPYCQIPLNANSPECPACRLTYPRASALLGAVPRLGEMVADTAGLLTHSELGRLKRRIVEIQNRFPQLVMQVVTHRFAEDHPFSLQVFWLFNAAEFAGRIRRGKDNHAIMIVVDPGRCEAAIIPGYGLEPFLTGEALGYLLELAGPAWESGRWADGILRVLDGLDTWLESIAIPNMKAAVGSADEF
jgi:uncharacterized membrane protein YgcG